jgi:hypothetical protein
MVKALPLTLIVLLFVSIQATIGSHGFSLRDEGFLLSNAWLMNQGEQPYTDFFLTTTPGSFVLQALAFKWLGSSAITGRYLYIFFCLILFFLFILWQNSPPKIRVISLIIIAISFIQPGGFAFYNLEGSVVALATTLVSYGGIKSRSRLFSFLGGMLLAALFWIKQSFGLLFPLFVFIGLYPYLKKSSKIIIWWLSGAVLIHAIITYSLWNQSSLSAAYDLIFHFATGVKMQHWPFICIVSF